MHSNQQIFNQALAAGCKTIKDFAIYIKNNTTSNKSNSSKQGVKFLEVSKTKAIKRYYSHK